VSGIFPCTLLGFTFCAYHYLHIAYVTQYLFRVKFTSPISGYSEWVTIVVHHHKQSRSEHHPARGSIQKQPTPVPQQLMVQKTQNTGRAHFLAFQRYLQVTHTCRTVHTRTPPSNPPHTAPSPFLSPTVHVLYFPHHPPILKPSRLNGSPRIPSNTFRVFLPLVFSANDRLAYKKKKEEKKRRTKDHDKGLHNIIILVSINAHDPLIGFPK